jgi:hypothetical protein
MHAFRRLCLPVVILLLPVAGVMAQDLHLTYRFSTGKKYLVHKTFDQTHEQRYGGDDNFLNTTDAIVTVESIDQKGTVTLLFTTLTEKYEPRGEAVSLQGGERTPMSGGTLRIATNGQDSTGKESSETPVTLPPGSRVTTRRPYDPPKYRATLASNGAFIAGEILEYSKEDLEFLEKMKQPGFMGHRISDAKMVQHLAASYFEPLPERSDTRLGSTWTDTLAAAGGRFGDDIRVWSVDSARHESGALCWTLTCRRSAEGVTSGGTGVTRNGTEVYWFRIPDGLMLLHEINATSEYSHSELDGGVVTTDSVARFLVRIAIDPQP